MGLHETGEGTTGAHAPGFLVRVRFAAQKRLMHSSRIDLSRIAAALKDPLV